MMRRRKRIGWWEDEGSERRRGGKSISFHYTLPSIWYMVLRGAGREESQMIIRDDGISLQFIVPLRRREKKEWTREREKRVDERVKVWMQKTKLTRGEKCIMNYIFLLFQFPSPLILFLFHSLLFQFPSLILFFFSSPWQFSLSKWWPFRYIVQDIHA